VDGSKAGFGQECEPFLKGVPREPLTVEDEAAVVNVSAARVSPKVPVINQRNLVVVPDDLLRLFDSKLLYELRVAIGVDLDPRNEDGAVYLSRLITPAHRHDGRRVDQQFGRPVIEDFHNVVLVELLVKERCGDLCVLGVYGDNAGHAAASWPGQEVDVGAGRPE